MFTDPNLFSLDRDIHFQKNGQKWLSNLAPKYEQIIEEPLPELHEKILQSAKKNKDKP